MRKKESGDRCPSEMTHTDQGRSRRIITKTSLEERIWRDQQLGVGGDGNVVIIHWSTLGWELAQMARHATS